VDCEVIIVTELLDGCAQSLPRSLLSNIGNIVVTELAAIGIVRCRGRLRNVCLVVHALLVGFCAITYSAILENIGFIQSTGLANKARIVRTAIGSDSGGVLGRGLLDDPGLIIRSVYVGKPDVI